MIADGSESEDDYAGMAPVKKTPTSNGGVLQTCGIDGCVYNTKHTGSMNRHRQAVHNIIAWQYCNQPECEYVQERAARDKSVERLREKRRE